MNNNYIQIIGLIAGILTSVSMLPQLIKKIKEKEAKDISGVMLFILILGVTLWLVYGILKKDIPLIVTNSFSLIPNLLLAFYCVRYGKK